MFALDDATKKRLLTRMARIEGQARGIQRMIDENRDCRDIVTQLAAMRAALSKVAFALISENLQRCISAADDAEREQILSEMEDALLKL